MNRESEGGMGMIRMFRVRLEFKYQDCWLGVFWRCRDNRLMSKIKHRDIWVCLIPMFPIHISWRVPK